MLMADGYFQVHIGIASEVLICIKKKYFGIEHVCNTVRHQYCIHENKTFMCKLVFQRSDVLSVFSDGTTLTTCGLASDSSKGQQTTE